MNNEIQILVADDHPMLLKGVTAELNEAKYVVVASVKNGQEAFEQLVALKPDVALLDVEMPTMTGFEVVQKAIAGGSKTKFIILTSHKEKGIVYKAQELGVDGYLLKDEPFVEINRCIQSVLKGKPYFSETFKEILNTKVSPQLKNMRHLSKSEKTILKYLADQKSSKEIAEIIGISHRTVEKHRSNIISKLEIKSQGLTAWIFENKTLVEALI